MECTWRDCKSVAEHEQIDRNGDVWANLCTDHHNQQKEDIDNMMSTTGKDGIKKMLSNWVKANGGAEKMSEKF